LRSFSAGKENVSGDYYGKLSLPSSSRRAIPATAHVYQKNIFL
jgi:hypothetical protein